MGEYPASSAPPSTNSRPIPVREDCWSEEATFTLIEAWGQRYIELNRGNLRQKQWQEVAEAVNDRHGHNKKARRTDAQCKNRIDTLKKKYKVEKSRVLESDGTYRSSWPFFNPLDELIGSSMTSKGLSPSPSPQIAPALPLSPTPLAVPLLPHKRQSPNAASTMPFQRESSSSHFRRNYSAIAAAAAAAEVAETDEEEEEEAEEEDKEVTGDCGGIRKLARVIERFGEVYVKVEAEKQRQMLELEKQRMQFAKELECQRMQMLVEMQVQLEKIKRAKGSDSNGKQSSKQLVSNFHNFQSE